MPLASLTGLRPTFAKFPLAIIQSVLTLVALHKKIIPASPGFSEVDEEIGFEPVVSPRAFHKNAALSISLGFGGANSARVLEAP